LGAKKLVSENTARGKHGVPVEDREQRKRDEEELRRRLWKSAPATAYVENIIQEPEPQILLLGDENERRSPAGLILP
jgi:hypothetical protein